MCEVKVFSVAIIFMKCVHDTSVVRLNKEKFLLSYNYNGFWFDQKGDATGPSYIYWLLKPDYFNFDKK